MLLPGRALAGLMVAALILTETRPGEAISPEPSPAQLAELLATIDARQNARGDYHASIVMEQSVKDKVTVLYKAEVYRRSQEQQFIIVFREPKSEQEGYLRIDRNLWLYDPTVGNWERRTERARIAGTNSRRSDLDESRLAEEYQPSLEGEGKLGAFAVTRLLLRARPGADVAFPVVKLWLEQGTANVLKREDLAMSGRLMRTSYYTKWTKVYSESKKGDMWFPQEVRSFDELEKGNNTFIAVKSVDLKPLPPNVFTKAWLESQLR